MKISAFFIFIVSITLFSCSGKHDGFYIHGFTVTKGFTNEVVKVDGNQFHTWKLSESGTYEGHEKFTCTQNKNTIEVLDNGVIKVLNIERDSVLVLTGKHYFVKVADIGDTIVPVKINGEPLSFRVAKN